jgi:hypothetical protein
MAAARNFFRWAAFAYDWFRTEGHPGIAGYYHAPSRALV